MHGDMIGEQEGDQRRLITAGGLQHHQRLRQLGRKAFGKGGKARAII